MIASQRRKTSTETSFPAIFEEYAPFVMRVMRHLGVPVKDVPDLCQDVFVAVFRGLPSFAGRSSLRTWIYGICLRVASNHRRPAHVWRRRSVSEPPEQSSPAVQDEAVEERRGHPALQLLLDVLDPDKREVFVLYELEEMSMKE